MFKYTSTEHLKRENLSKQFADTRNHNEVSFANGKYTYHEYNFDSVSVSKFEEETLIKLINENKKYAKYWNERGMMYNYENIVTDPEKFVAYLRDRFGLVFDEKLLEKGIKLMDKRPLKDVIELNLKRVEETLVNLNCSDQTKHFIINEQDEYIKML